MGVHPSFAILAVCLVPVGATAAMAACGRPTITAPIVPYEIYTVAADVLNSRCPKATYSCSYPAPSWFRPDGWVILVNEALSDEDKVCSLVFEKGHLPPNYWKPAADDQAVSVPGPIA